jgi:hypothetical protein
MKVRSVLSPGEARDHRPRRGAGAEAQVQGLERLREALLKRLERIEALAAEQAALLDSDSTDREQALRERVAALEASNARVVAEARRREQEWQEVLRQVEADRRLLAEAWERLEEQQVHGEPRAESRPAPERPAAPERPVPVLAAVRPPGDDPDDPVTRAILRQFQVLSGDVRRNAKGRAGW